VPQVIRLSTPLKKMPLGDGVLDRKSDEGEVLTATAGQTEVPFGPRPKISAPTWIPLEKPRASIIAPSEPKMVMLSFKTRTVSRYVPVGRV